MAPKANETDTPVRPSRQSRERRANRRPGGGDREQRSNSNRRDRSQNNFSKSVSPRRHNNIDNSQRSKFNNIIEKLDKLEREIKKKQDHVNSKDKVVLRRRKQRKDTSMERPPSRPQSTGNIRMPRELSIWPDLKSSNYSADESKIVEQNFKKKSSYDNRGRQHPLAPLSIYQQSADRNKRRDYEKVKNYPKMEISKRVDDENRRSQQQDNNKVTVLDFSNKVNLTTPEKRNRSKSRERIARSHSPGRMHIPNAIKQVKTDNPISYDFSANVQPQTATTNRNQLLNKPSRNSKDSRNRHSYHDVRITPKTKDKLSNTVSCSSSVSSNEAHNIYSPAKNASSNMNQEDSNTTDSGISTHPIKGQEKQKRKNKIGEKYAENVSNNNNNSVSLRAGNDKITDDVTDNQYQGKNYAKLTNKRKEEKASVNIGDVNYPPNSPRKSAAYNGDDYNKEFKHNFSGAPEAKDFKHAVKYDLTTAVEPVDSQRKETDSKEFVNIIDSYSVKGGLPRPKSNNKLSNENIYCKVEKVKSENKENKFAANDGLQINKKSAYRRILNNKTDRDSMADIAMRNRSNDYLQVNQKSNAVDRNGNYKRRGNKKSNRRESTSPDEGISYSPDTDNSPTCPRRGGLSDVQESKSQDNPRILIDIKGGAVRSSRPHKTSRKHKHDSKSSNIDSDKHHGKSKNKSSNKVSDPRSPVKGSKPVWVEISKDPRMAAEKDKTHIQKAYHKQMSTENKERKHNEPFALEINYKSKYGHAKNTDSRINKKKTADSNKYDVDQSRRTRALNAGKSEKTSRRREVEQKQPSKKNNKYEMRNGQKSRHGRGRSLSVDSSITDLSYSSSVSSSSYESSAYSDESRHRASSSSSYSSSILTSSSESHLSDEYSSKTRNRSKKEASKSSNHVVRRPKARSDERHSRTRSNSSLVGRSNSPPNKHTDKSVKKSDKGRSNYRTKAKSQRRVEDGSHEPNRLSDENQVFETQIGARKTRSKRVANNDHDKERSNWQHQRLVMASIRPGDLPPQSKTPVEKQRQGRENREAFKGKSFEASTKDSNGSVLTIRDLYSLHHVLSDTQNGTVIAGHRRSDGMRVAIKRIAKSGTTRWGWMGGKVVPLELALICQVNEVRHGGVVEIVEWHETTEAFLLVMVRPHPSVDLYDHVTKQKRLKESVARSIIKQLVSAISHCHKYGVLHRDVKLENILFSAVTNDTILIDFGCGDYHRLGSYKEFAGTPEYYPPEWFVCKQYTGESATVWSMGVLLYALLCGTLPFRSSKDITQKEISKFPSDVSSSARDLILSMLKKNPRERVELKKVLEYRWFSSSSSDKNPNRKTSV